MKKLIILIILLSSIIFAKNNCEEINDLKIKILNKKILVGDEINYEFSFKTSKNEEYYLKEDNLSPFELIDKKNTKLNENNIFIQKYNLKLTIYETGEQKIPEIELIKLKDKKQSCIKIPEKKIFVESVLKNSNEQNIKDIKGFKSIKEKNYTILWIFLTIIVLIIIFILIKKLKLKEENKKELIVKKIDPKELALQKLSKLTKDNLINKNQIQEYYFRLSEIIREYIGGVYDFDSVEMTSDELKYKIRNIGTNIKQSDLLNLDNFLDDSDLVKFSKFRPNKLENDQITELALSIIDNFYIKFNIKEEE